MAKDMSKVYSEMLTRELVALKKKHQVAHWDLGGANTRFAVKERARLIDLINQINAELADRVAQMGIFA